MSLVNLSLDEIIARRRGTDKKSNGSTNRFRSNRKKRDFAPEYSTTNSAFTRPEDVPSGKWDHSGFEEMYGNGSGDGSSPLPALERGGRFNRVDLARKVRLHITNLAPTVNSADLNELFEEYSIISANVNYDEMGESVGTADVVTDRVTAREIVANLDGVALDGEVMSFHMIDDQTIPASRNVPVKNRLSFRERSWGVIKKRPPKRPLTGIKNRRKNRSKRPQMTDEELDRELEEYMNKRGHQKQEEQKMEKMEI
ncbi:RNA binding protein [Loa loa]|uniref:RNA binding protein n=1 Tax=Loa loa TaxID=7209 RepID=A0A1S0TZ59_LOALO|nr:RNA binding protein [Loa loa]EFO21821.2 RNA binding protein [Loa loa]